MKTGELKERAERAKVYPGDCCCCQHRCGVDRFSDERGYCRTGQYAMVSAYGPHFGEEAPLVGINGSGTIFFSRCNMRCDYCQNHEISQGDAGVEMPPEMLAEIMLRLQDMGCHNINLVSPSHVVPQVLGARRHLQDFAYLWYITAGVTTL